MEGSAVDNDPQNKIQNGSNLTNGCAGTRNGETDFTDEEKNTGSPRPFFYCRFVTKYPLASFVLTLSGHLLMTITTGALVLSGYDLFPTNFETLPLDLRDQPWQKRDFAFRVRNSFPNRVVRRLHTPFNLPKYRYKRGEPVELIYDAGDGNIYDKQNLLKMKEIEDSVMRVEKFHEYCQLMIHPLTMKTQCIKPLSILRFFDGTFALVNPIFYDPDFNNISKVLYTASVTNLTKSTFEYSLAINHVITPDDVRAPLTRSLLLLGSPLANVTSTKDKIKEYMKEYLKPKLESFRNTTVFDFFYYSYEMMLSDVREQALFDMMLAIGSVLFIWAFMCYHTRSLWITCLAVYSILSSFLGANLIYRIVLGYTYFGFFHILAIFIVLGIGADDLFVFYDSWRATAFKVYPSLAHRLSDAYRKSALSMLITSLTTMFAFIANAVSPLLATKSFGVFSGILILINYLSVIVFFPTVVVMYHKYFEKYCCCCCRPEAEVVSRSSENGISKQSVKSRRKQPLLVRFFKGRFFRFVTNKYARWIIIGVFLSLIGFFGYQASRLEAESEQLQLYRKSHNYAQAIKRNLYSFVPNELEKSITLYLVWGLKENDLSECYFSAVKCRGTRVSDDGYDPSTPQAQLAFKRLCDAIYNFTEEEISSHKIRRDTVSGRLEVSCFTKDMETFFSTDTVSSTVDVSLPWTWNKTYFFINGKSNIYNTSGFNSTFQRYLDIPVTYWLYDGFSMNLTNDFVIYNNLIAEMKDTFTQNTEITSKPAPKIGNRIRYIAVQINTTLNGQALSYVDGLPVVELWENFMKKQLAEMPSTLQGGFQTTRIFWHWLHVQKALADNAILGIGIGLGLAFPVLVLATQNLILGVLSSLSIGCVTVCVIGVIPLAGWKLGVLVSLNMCLVVGLSVDYVVHLAEGYHLSNQRDRKLRVQDTLESMGISVFSGACTTLGASFFMLFAQIQFFFQFGIFMFCTIGFSLLFSMMFFTTVIAIIGPSNDQGDFVVFFKRLCTGRKVSVTKTKNESVPEEFISHL